MEAIDLYKWALKKSYLKNILHTKHAAKSECGECNI